MLIEIVVFETRDGGHFLRNYYETVYDDIKQEHKNAIRLLDAAAIDTGYATINGVGVRTVTSTGSVKYHIDEAFIHATER